MKDFKYTEAPKLKPMDYLSTKMIKCKKLNYSVDPNSHNLKSSGKSVNCMSPFAGKAESDFAKLFEGETVFVTKADPSTPADLVIIYKNGNEKLFQAEDIEGFIFGGYSSRFWVM